MAEDNFKLFLSTWKGFRPHFHHSESAPGPNPRAHADMPSFKPNNYGNEEIIWEVELKSKDAAILALEKM